MTMHHDNYEAAAKSLIDQLGKTIVIGVPLGLGKPVGLLNALYRLALQDKSIQLTITTALTLGRPPLKNELEKRFIGPFLDRILGNYEELLYEEARVQQRLPENIRVTEFFLSTAKYLHNNYVQQNYISSGYSWAARDIIANGINVIAQMVAHSHDDADLYSLSCNSDLFHDIIRRLKESGRKFAAIVEVNNNLPFMLGEAVISSNDLTDIVDTGNYRTLFSVPHDDISIADHLIGFYTSTLIKDDSCLQIGIGKLSNALTASMILRHKDNALYQDLLKQFKVAEKFSPTVPALNTLGQFNKGINASTEMLCDGYLQLYKEDILKKYVYDHVGLQRLLNDGVIKENFSPDIIEILLNNKIISSQLSEEDVEFLKKFGIFKAEVQFDNNSLTLSNGEKISSDLNRVDISSLKNFLGSNLSAGKLIHAAFFLGSSDMYQQLRDLSLEELQYIDMTSVWRTNTLMWNPELLALQRKDARFVNSAMMVTLGGVIISDGLRNMREVSGVGGQFDFANMALNLPDSRCILNCRSTRVSKGKTESNIVWCYTNVTLPRFLRDIVITEYGIADLRGKTDSDVIKAMLNVSDSRFQEKLLSKAKRSGKIATHYQIPEIFRNNYPEAVDPPIRAVQPRGYFHAFPFGTELTPVEQTLGKALIFLQSRSSLQLMGLALRALFFFKSEKHFTPYLQRMQMEKSANLQEYFYKKLLMLALDKTAERPVKKEFSEPRP